MRLSFEDIMNMERIRRLIFINSLSGFKCPCLIGTVSDSGVDNLALFNSVVHIGSNPPLIGFIMRPVTVPRHTYSNIRSGGEYTINHVSIPMIEQAHQTSANYAVEVSEFEATGLTPRRYPDFSAPGVDEANVVLGMKLKEELDITSNDTKLLVGEIQFIDIPDDVLRDDGSLDLEKSETATVSGLHSYYKSELVNRLGYAKPDLHQSR